MQHLSNEQLLDYLHKALAPEQDALLHAHIDECSLCRAEYAAEIGVSELLRSQAGAEERELPPMLKASIWQAIRDEHTTPLQVFRNWLRPAYAIPVAAALLAGAFFAPAFLHGSNNNQTPSIDAAYYLQDHAAMNSTVPFADHNVATSEFEMSSNVDQTAISPVPVIYTADAIH